METHLHMSNSQMFIRQLSQQIFDYCVVKPGSLLGKAGLWLLLLMFTNFAANAQQDCGRPTKAYGTQWGLKLIGSSSVNNPEYAIDGNMKSAATLNNGPISAFDASSELNIEFGTPLQVRSGIPDTVVVKFEMPAAFKLDIAGAITVTMFRNGSQVVGSYDVKGRTLFDINEWQNGGQPFGIFKQAVPGDVDRVSVVLKSGLLAADVSQLFAPLGVTNENTALKVYEAYGVLGVPRMDSILRKSTIVIRNGETATFSVREDKRNLGYRFKWFTGYRDQTPIYTGFDFKPAVLPSVTEQRYTYYVTIEKDGCLLQSKIPVYLIVNPQAQLLGSIAPSRTIVNKVTPGETGRLDYTIRLVNNGAAKLQPSARIFIKDIPMPVDRYQIQRITLPQGEIGRYDATTGSLTGVTLDPGDTIKLDVLGIVDTTYQGVLRNSATGSDELGLPIPITESPFVFVNVSDTSGNNGTANICPATERICNRPDRITYETAFDPAWGQSIQQDISSVLSQGIESVLALGNGLKNILQGVLTLNPVKVAEEFFKAILDFLNWGGTPAPSNIQYAGDGNEGTAVTFEPDILQLGQWQAVSAHFDSSPLIAGDSVVVLFSEDATFRVQVGTIRVYMYYKDQQVGGYVDLKEAFALQNIVPWVSGGMAFKRVAIPVSQKIDKVQVSVTGVGADLGINGTRVYEISRRPQQPKIETFMDKLSVQVEQGEEVRLKVKDEKRGECMIYKWYTEEDLGKTPFATGPEAVAKIPAGFTGTKYYYLQALANACSDNPTAPLEIRVDVLPSPMLEGVVTTEVKNPKVENGGRIRYVLTIDNNGLQTLPDTARLKIKAISENDKNFKIDSITVLGRGRFDMRTGEFTGDSIPPNGKLTLVISGVIPPTYAGQPININVSGWHLSGKQIPIRQAPPVTPNYHLKVKKVPDQLRVGRLQKLDYTIIITNNGTESFPAASKLYIKDVPRQKGYRIDRMYVPESSSTGGYYVTEDSTLRGAEIPAGGTAEIRVEGFLTEEYEGGPINNDVIATDENGIPLEVEPTPTVNAGEEKYTLYGHKLAISREGEVKAGDQLDFVITLYNKGPEAMPASAKTYIRDMAPRDYIIQEISVADGKGQYNEPVLTGVELAPGDSVRLIVSGYLSNNYRGDTIVNRVIGKTENGTPIDITPSPVINPGFKLGGDKQPDKLKANAGEALNYTITLVNSGKIAMPAGQKVYIKDVPQSEFYVIDNISVIGNTGVYDMKILTLQTSAPLAPNEKISLLVKGHIREDYKTGEIGNRVEVRTDSTKHEIPPAPIVNEVKYRMQLAKVANSQEPVGPGFPVEFTITLRHKGNVDIKPSDKVMVVDTLPAGFELSGFEPSTGTYDPKTHYWTGLNLISGQSARLLVKGRISPGFKGDSLVNKVSGKAPDGTNIEVDSSARYAVVKIDTTKRLNKLELRKVAGKAQVTSGDSLGFVIILKNLDDKVFEADKITVRDMTPEGYVVKKEEVTASTGNYDAASGNWTDLKIPAGDSVTIRLNGQVRGDFWGEMTNMALGFDQYNLPIRAAGSADNMARATVRVNPPASKYKLLLQKKADKSIVKAGDSLTYTITLSNNGELNLADTIVTVKDTLPAAYTVGSYKVSNGNYDLQSGRWTNLTLPAGQSVTLTLKGRVSSTFSGKLVNTVGGLDPKGIPIENTPGNRSEVIVEPVKPVYKLALAKVVKSSQSLIRPGDSLNFEIKLYNNGGDAITPKDTVTVVDQIPDGYNVHSFVTSQGTYNSTTGQWTGFDLKSGDSVTILVRGALSKDFTGSSVTNRVSGKDPNKEPIPAVPGKGEARINVDAVKYSLMLSKAANSATAMAGGPLDFTITLRNQGPRAILPTDTVVVKDQVPAGYTVTSFVPGAGKYDANSGRWTGLNVAAGQHVTLLVKGTVNADYKGANLTNKVTGLTPKKDSIPVENGGGSTVTIDGKDPVNDVYKLLLSKKANSTSAKAGGPLDFTITLLNHGPRVIQPTDTVIVKDQVPAGYTVTSFVPGAGKYDANSGRWTGLNVAAGQHVTLLVKGTVNADYKGTNLTNKVTGLTPKKDSIPVENGGGSTVTIDKEDPYKLLLSKKANSTSAKAGGPLDFTITLLNHGPRVILPTDTVIVKDQVPAGYTVTSFVPGAGKYDANSGRWTGLNIAAGQHVTLLVKGTVNVDYKGTNLTNKVTGLTPKKDSIPVENGGGSTVTIDGKDPVNDVYKLLLSKKANSTSAKAGGPLDFTITLLNHGPRVIQPTDTVIVKDQVPAGYTVTSFVPGAGKYDANSGRWTGLNIAAGQHVTLLVKGTVSADYKGTNLTNKVTGLTPKKDSIPVENGGGSTVTIDKEDPYKLLLSKKANSTSAKAGGPLDFTITLRNQGPRAILPGDTVTVTDQVPAGYTVISFVPDAGTYDANSGRWTGLNVAAGQQVTLLVKGMVRADYSGNSLTNKVTGLTPNGDPIPVDNGGASTVEIRQDLVVPNVITPNGDGVNDVLRIKGLERYKNPELVVINRWNNMVYKNSNYDNTWNGSGLLEGTYFYVLTVKDETGKAIIKRGYIMVLR